MAAKLRRTPVTFATLFDAPQPVTDGNEDRNAVAGEIGSVAAGQKQAAVGTWCGKALEQLSA